MSCTTRCAANGQPPSQATQHRRSPAERPIVGRKPQKVSAPAEPVLGPRPTGFRRYEPICGAAEPGRESLISTRNLQLAYELISSLVWQTRRLPEDLIRGSLSMEFSVAWLENQRVILYRHELQFI
jgi:hypothetical protein